ncbi:MAG: T9SS type A sorting domain-containing protein [Bacteroidetes bacterium]|nr:T9SS type A sorting domain-containing protein [Bacteroidota bacterium]
MKLQLIFLLFLSIPGIFLFGQNSEWKQTENELLLKTTEQKYQPDLWLSDFQYYDSTGYWSEIGPYTSSSSRTKDVGRLSCLTIDPENDSIVIAGSPNGGLYYTLDKGKTWINGGLDRPFEEHGIKIFTPGISSIVVIHDQGKSFWIVSTGDKDHGFSRSRGVLRTSDYGKNWERINGSGTNTIPGNWYYLRRLVSHPQNKNVMFALSSRGLYRTDNILAEQASDIKWDKILDSSDDNDEGLFDMEFSIGSADTIFLSKEYRASHKIVGDEILWSIDGGESWEPLPGSNLILPIGDDFNFFLTNFEVSPAAPNELFLYIKGTTPTDSNYYYHHHLKYNIDQNQWSNLNSIPFTKGNGRNGYAVSPVNPQLIYCATVPTFVSTDGGYNWVIDNDTLLEDGSPKDRPHSDIQDLKFNQSGTEIWAASDGGPFMKRIGDSLWQNKTNNIGFAKILKFDQSELDPDYYLFGGWDVGTQLYYKKTGKWSQGAGGDGFGCAFDDRDGGVFYVAGYSGDHNIFSKFTSYTDSVNYLFGDFWSANIAVSQVDHKRVYISLKDNVTVTDDQGNYWYSMVDINDLGLDPQNYIIYDVYVSDCNGQYVYLRVVNINQGTHPQVYKTENARANVEQIRWENITPDPPLQNWLSDIAIDESNPERIWIVYNTLKPQKILEYDGEKWTNISGNLTDLNCGINAIAHLKGTSRGLFAGTLYGIYYLENDSADWVLYKPGLPNNVPAGIKINYSSHSLLTGLDGRGLWETELPADYSEPDRLKQKNESMRIYPNPVEDYFEVWSPLLEGNVNLRGNSYLRVYNTYGQEVAAYTLTGFTNNHSFSCNHWQSGVYFATIIINGKMQETVKFIIR